MSNGKPKETYLMDVAVSVFKGLEFRGYERKDAIYMPKHDALRISTHDPETKRTYSIVIKEVDDERSD
jgi:hypothetical protein